MVSNGSRVANCVISGKAYSCLSWPWRRGPRLGAWPLALGVIAGCGNLPICVEAGSADDDRNVLMAVVFRGERRDTECRWILDGQRQTGMPPVSPETAMPPSGVGFRRHTDGDMFQLVAYPEWDLTQGEPVKGELDAAARRSQAYLALAAKYPRPWTVDRVREWICDPFAPIEDRKEFVQVLAASRDAPAFNYLLDLVVVRREGVSVDAAWEGSADQVLWEAACLAMYDCVGTRSVDTLVEWRRHCGGYIRDLSNDDIAALLILDVCGGIGMGFAEAFEVANDFLAVNQESRLRMDVAGTAFTAMPEDTRRPDGEPDYPRIQDKFGLAAVVVTMSNIAYNRKRDAAFVFVQLSQEGSGVRGFYLLRKVDGFWREARGGIGFHMW
jgi:hypothetical protein